MQAFKVLIFFIFYCTANQLAAQVYFGKVKCDSFLVMQDSTKAIIYRKNKVTVYDKKQGKFRMKPTKDPVFYIQEQDLLVKIEKDKIKFIFIQEGNRSISFSGESSDFASVEFPLGSTPTLDSLVLVNNAYLNYKSGAVATDEVIKDFEPNLTYSVQRLSNGLLVIHDTRKPSTHMDYEFEQFVYEDGGSAQSGVYDPKQRKWIIPPIYESIELIGNNVIAKKSDPFVQGMDDPTAGLNHSYDFYQIYDGGVVQLRQENITENIEFNLAQAFDMDSVENRLYGTNIVTNKYITYRNGKQGLVEFQLFEMEDYRAMGRSNFLYNEILPPKYDYVLNDVKGENIVTLEEGLQKPISLYRRTKDPETSDYTTEKIVSAESELIYGANIFQLPNKADIPEEYVLVDGHLYYWPELTGKHGSETPHQTEKSIRFDGIIMGQPKSVGLQFHNDSLLHVIDFESDFEDIFAYPLNSVIYPYPDSVVIDDGEIYAAYPGPEPGYEKSGLFNLNSNEWLVERDYKMIHKRANGMLLEEVIRNEIQLYDSESYSLLKLDGTYIFQNIVDKQGLKMQLEPLFGEKPPVTYIEYPEKSVYRENYGYEEGFYRYEGDHYAVTLASGDWQIQQPIKGDYFNVIPLTKPAEFAHYNPSYYYYFWMDQDSIYLEIGGSLYGADRENGKINLDIIDLQDDQEWRVHVISGQDTITHTSFLFLNQIEGYTTASFYVAEDVLFVNEPQYYDNITPNAYALDVGFEEDLEGIMNFRSFDTETSYICKLTDGVWKKTTPYYASIQQLPYGYLVFTGDEQEIVDLYNYTEKNEPGSYLVLDTNFKAISYVDFYDFSEAIIHSFGLQLCANKCFLVGNGGKMITTANWDEFLLEDGQIKAVRYKPLPEDEYWYFEDEREIEEFKFYPLPKQ